VAVDPLWAEALRIHFDAIVVDGHIDTPSLMLDSDYDLGARHSAEHVDLPRMVEGGLDAPFFAIYVGRSYGEGQAATDRALAMTEAVQRQVNALDGVDMATSAAEVADITRAGRKAILLGLEGGHALQGDVNVLRQLYANGIRYVTLTHTNTNSWADASTDAPRWGGLNDLGRSLVREMNRLGVLVDLSHVSDSTFYDAIETSAAPVLLSHTSCRALHDHARNIDDDALRALRANGGVILINFYDAYIGTAPVTVDTILDHIEHAIEVAGIDHVGLGSDFDGVPSLPVGMEDATRLPWITYGLLKRGHSEEDVRKVLGGNALRLLADAERIGQQIRASGAR
jgi:membrane dipeptidase